MMMYMLIAGVIFVGSMLALLTGPTPVAAVLFPIPVALYVARHQMGRTLGLIACAVAGAVATVAGGEFAFWTKGAAVAQCVLLASAGVPLGMGIARKWTYGWTLTATAAVAYVGVLCGIAFVWSEWQAVPQKATDIIVSSQASAQDATWDLVVQNTKWLKDHWLDVSFGMFAWPLAAGLSISISMVAARTREKFNLDGLRGSFREMRVSEWLVWAAILVAVLWFVGSHWPGTVPSVLTWNAAIALAAIYWLNGLSILVYGYQMLRPNLFFCLVVLWLLILTGVYPALCLLGLFDTWADFRKTVDRIVTAVRNAQLGSSNQDEE